MRPGLRLNILGALCVTVLIAAGPPDAPVADAAMKGDIEAVRALLRDGKDVNAAHSDGMTALHWASEHGDVAMVEMLIFAGADADAVTRIGQYTPLHVASRGGSTEVVTALLEAGANADAVTDPSGSTVLHLAAAAGVPELVAILLDRGADPNAREAEWGQTPLIFAASLNRADAIRVLIEGGADPGIASIPIDLQEQGRIDSAVRQRQNDVLSAFTDDGSRPATSTQLQAAVRAGREIYTTGIPEPEEEDEDEEEDGQRGSSQRRAPSISTKGGLTPLLHAVRQGHREATMALLEGGADVDQVGGGDGTTPLLMATINGQFDDALKLIEHGADPNIASTLNGVAPLWATINSEWQPRTRYAQPQERGYQEAGYLDVMEALLEAGAEPDHRISMHPWYLVYTGCGNGNCGLINTNGSTSFLRAAYATDVAAMRLLRSYGADPHVPTKAPEPRRRRNQAETRRAEAIERLTDADEELEDSTRVSLLTEVWSQLPDSVKADFPDFAVTEIPDAVQPDILAHAERQDSARVRSPDRSGLRLVPVGGPGVHPIHSASGVGYGEGYAGNAHRHVPDGWMPAVKYLIEEVGADVNARDHNGYTALHHAAARGHDEMILYLIEKGADVTVVSRRGQTTADMANGPVSRISPFPATVALLESLGSINNHNCVTCQ